MPVSALVVSMQYAGSPASVAFVWRHCFSVSSSNGWVASSGMSALAAVAVLVLFLSAAAPWRLSPRRSAALWVRYPSTENFSLRAYSSIPVFIISASASSSFALAACLAVCLLFVASSDFFSRLEMVVVFSRK